MSSTNSARAKLFRKTVWGFHKAHGRHGLPWRKTRDPYRILVSEVMLQQTQVDRVIPYYQKFLKAYPTAKRLAAASLADVLALWQGLGYNRRAKMLHEAAKRIVEEHKGRFPSTIEGIESLPGVGPYTARAVAAFAYDTDSVFIETNIRTAVIRHFFRSRKTVSDADIEKALLSAKPKGRAREWNAALMDYGSYLKRAGVRTNARVKGYAKQSAFKGSFRETRGLLLRHLLDGPMKAEELISSIASTDSVRVKSALASLVKDGLVELKSGRFRLPR